MKYRSRWSDYISPEDSEGLKNRPFENLASLVRKAKKELKKEKKAKDQEIQKKRESLSDEQLFLEAMKGVEPLSRQDDTVEEIPQVETARIEAKKEAEDIKRGIEELRAVVAGHRPLPIEKIPEYMDGPSFNMDKGLVRKLRRGQFAIQAYCELHGLRSDEALQVMDGFIADAIMNNMRAVAFIHGRGKSSPGKPVLKGLVKDFLNRGRFRHYILAYSSAPAWDGGPGVTYVLIRKRPVKKKKRR